MFTSNLAWHPVNVNLISSVDYEGTVTLFDIRTSFPLQVAENIHKGKIFANAWKNENIVLTGTFLFLFCVFYE